MDDEIEISNFIPKEGSAIFDKQRGQEHEKFFVFDGACFIIGWCVIFKPTP
jgi:hypothetical protein